MIADVRPLSSPAEARQCAELMASMEPWLTLGRSAAEAESLLNDPAKEVYVARLGQEIAGFLILDMRGLLRGYIQTVCVAPSHQHRGLGSFLVEWAEQRIRRESPNVFLCVSSFNPGARRLYERLGYRQVGILENYLIPGHHEILMRKSQGPWSGFEAR